MGLESSRKSAKERPQRKRAGVTEDAIRAEKKEGKKGGEGTQGGKTMGSGSGVSEIWWQGLNKGEGESSRATVLICLGCR